MVIGMSGGCGNEWKMRYVVVACIFSICFFLSFYFLFSDLISLIDAVVT